MDGVIQTLLDWEWAMFQQAQNRGGRAACQDDRQTFDIMRSSQLLAWSEAVRESYRRDLLAARAAGRNLMWEKYGQMMARTHPAEYEVLRQELPPLSPEKQRLIAPICAAHVAWLETLAQRFPRLCGRGRPIRQSQDSPQATSFETYLWGELTTYSQETLRLYEGDVARLLAAGENLHETVLVNTAKQYGFLSLEAAEQALVSKRP